MLPFAEEQVWFKIMEINTEMWSFGFEPMKRKTGTTEMERFARSCELR
jgi:hypothetical protein